MPLILETPTRLRLQGYNPIEVRPYLTYTDETVLFDLRKHKSAYKWFAKKHGEEAYHAKLDQLNAAKTTTLLFEDDRGFWTYSGLAPLLSKTFGDTVETAFAPPPAKLIPWDHPPLHKTRHYQALAKMELRDARHAGVEIGTGLGKSLVVVLLLKDLGLPAVVMAPSISIAEQLYRELVFHFGRRYVGQFFDGKKQSDKHFVVAVAASLTRVGEGSKQWADLSSKSVFVADESHLCPAKTLATVCFGVMAAAPYRFFLSGTQLRNDGLDLLLDAITGPICFRMTVREGVDQGFLAKPIFRMVEVQSDNAYDSKDAMRMTRTHLYYNPKVNAAAADIANRSVTLMQRPTLLLVEEVEQFAHLLPHFQCEARFAHGGVNKDNRDKVPTAHHASNPNQLVAEFNAGKFPILVGTSCISTGTDIKAAATIVYLQGGTSETQVKQAVGRGTRLFMEKVDCLFIDMDVHNVATLHRHASARRAIYGDIYGPVSTVHYEV